MKTREWESRGRGQLKVSASGTRPLSSTELGEVDPATSKELIPDVQQYKIRRVPRYLLLLDHLLSIWLCLLPVLAALLQCCMVVTMPLTLLAAAWPVRAWACSRSCLCTRRGLWYEETRWGHRAAARAVLLAGLVEIVLLAAFGMIGVLISVWLRCFTLSQQSVGERIAGVRLVREEVFNGELLHRFHDVP